MAPCRPTICKGPQYFQFFIPGINFVELIKQPGIRKPAVDKECPECRNNQWKLHGMASLFRGTLQSKNENSMLCERIGGSLEKEPYQAIV